MTRLGALGLVTACIIGAGVGAYGGAHDAQSPDPVYPVNTSDTPWLDGCSTDADCAAMDRALTKMGRTLDGCNGDLTCEGDVASEGESVYELAWLNIDCEFVTSDVVAETPCIVPTNPFTFTDMDNVDHDECVVILTTAEDSELVCNDDTVWPS